MECVRDTGYGIREDITSHLSKLRRRRVKRVDRLSRHRRCQRERGRGLALFSRHNAQ